MIWICIPVHNGVKYTIECIDSLMKQSYKNFQIVVCDDGSSDNTELEVKCKYKNQVIVLRGNGNLWWAGAMNMCLKFVLRNCEADDYILMLNNDLVVEEDFLENIIDKVDKKCMYGSISADINNPQKIVYAGELINRFTAKPTHFHKNYNEYAEKKEWESDTLTGRGTLFPVILLEEIGFMNNSQMPQYAADNDYAIRAKKSGYRLLIRHNCIVYSHVENTGVGSIYKKNSFIQFLKSFNSLKSPNYYKSRFFLALNYTPKAWVPFFLMLQFMRIVGAYTKKNLLKI